MRVVFFSATLAAGLAFAADPPQHRGPPQEALTACSGLHEGSACGFTFNGTNLTGQCRKGPSGEAAACFPEGGRHHGPPPEAVEACNGKSEGTACTVSFDGKSLNGTCSNGPHRSDTIACRPEGGPGGHHGPPPEASAACSGKAEGATCSFTHHDRTLEGTCRTGPNGDALACAPQRPN